MRRKESKNPVVRQNAMLEVVDQVYDRIRDVESRERETRKMGFIAGVGVLFGLVIASTAAKIARK